MKEDILEQLVEDYLQHEGYFTRHNLKFRPRPEHSDFAATNDSNYSDIDVLGFNPHKGGYDRVWAVNCKSWQGGLNLRYIINLLEGNGKLSGKEAWKTFRELTKPKWSEAFISKVREETGSDQFTYITAVTAAKGERSVWESHEPFRNAMGGNPIRIITFSDMLQKLTQKQSTTLASSDLGRMLQLMKASGCTFSFKAENKTGGDEASQEE